MFYKLYSSLHPLWTCSITISFQRIYLPMPSLNVLVFSLVPGPIHADTAPSETLQSKAVSVTGKPHHLSLMQIMIFPPTCSLTHPQCLKAPSLVSRPFRDVFCPFSSPEFRAPCGIPALVLPSFTCPAIPSLTSSNGVLTPP